MSTSLLKRGNCRTAAIRARRHRPATTTAVGRRAAEVLCMIPWEKESNKHS
ncbi:MAG: hypothetical protein IKA50_00845 [Clostridia bacterium]|nr:hypothetical protein [Clostridia bacterium]